MSLSGLPNEVLLEIIKYLHPTPGPQFEKAHWGLLAESESSDICHLANVSTRFYILCRTRLYTLYIQNGNASLGRLLRTVLGRPDLAQHFRYVNLVPGRSDELMPWFGAHGSVNPGHGFMVSSDFNSQDAKHWYDEVSRGDWQAMVAILLASLPNLQEIHIPDLGRADEQFLHLKKVLMVIADRQKNSIASPLSLPKLKRLSIGWNRANLKDKHNHWGAIDIKHVIPWLALKSITTFHGIELRTDPVAPISWSHCGGIKVGSGLRELELSRCNLTAETLRDFVRPLENIESFSYEEGGESIGDYDCDPRGFIPAVAHLRQTLKSFTFINRETTILSHLERMTLGFFRGFEVLENIDTMAFSLILENDEPDAEGNVPTRLVDVIPPTLKDLILRECETRPNTTRHVLRLLKYRKIYAPNLQRVVLERKGEEFGTGEVFTLSQGVKDMKLRKPELRQIRSGRGIMSAVIIRC